MRKQIAAANWKMNLTYQQGKGLLEEIISQAIILTPEKKVVFAVPFPYLRMAKKKVKGKAEYDISAQNCYHKKAGAFTGEVSVEMIRSTGAKYVIIGHSERREYFHETNEMLADKINLALENSLVPIFCCGESLSVREAGEELSFVGRQLKESLFHLSALQILNLVIAYEPIWAIGTGKTATAKQAQDMHAYIRSALAEQYGKQVAESISILYGGSVKGSNAVEIFSQPDVDGGLVGGASLNATEFVTIINALK
jgi:triosephosphate isomerase